MRFSFLAVFALTSLSFATPTLGRRADAVSVLTDLLAEIKVHTGAINGTLAGLSPLDVIGKAAAVNTVGQSITAVTASLNSAAASIKALAPSCSTKRSNFVSTTSLEISAPIEKRQLGIEVAVLLTAILLELFATLAVAIGVLGVTVLLIFLTPMTGGLSALILSVQLLLDTLLIGVVVLLNTLLTGLAIIVAPI
ncbi:hypothetical protein WAI453_005813 [Rhynchosporium graminicola]|uniref:Uncharacterized protein n=1 Tax=Rhynchosporium graminicola TaxID=2792576 RepID=A0A1E1KK78_9HELO|nr:uncharacterized protein RCO7_04188 [Rhynchosporium commune]